MKVFDETALYDAIQRVSKASNNNTWFYLVMLEATVYQAHFPLDEDTAHTKAFSKLKYTRDTDYLKEIAVKTGLMKPEYISAFFILNAMRIQFREHGNKSFLPVSIHA